MKNLFFAAGIIVYINMISCSSTANLKNVTCDSAKPSENFFMSRNAVCEKTATAMIKNFPHHKPHFLGHKEKKLLYAYAKFDTADLKSVVKSLNKIDSVVFSLAAWTDKKKRFFPTVLMTCYMSASLDKNYNNVQYIKSIGYCPPPTDGCPVISSK